MGYYLIDNPPKSSQYKNPRRERLSGVVVVHTTESVMDTVDADTGAENVARFVSNRTDPGSYHVLSDSDSAIDMMPDSYESYQVAVNGHNRHAWGIAAATRASLWTQDSSWDSKAIAIMGRKIREFWQRNGFDVQKSARWISAAEVENIRRNGGNVAGLVCHGDLQPADRSDAWARHPRRAELNAALISAIIGGDTNPPAGQGAKKKMIASAENLDGRVEEFRIGNGETVEGQVLQAGKVYQRYQPVKNGKFTKYVSMNSPGVVDQITAFRNADGRVEVVIYNSHPAFGQTFRTFQTSAGKGPWRAWVAL